MLRFVNLVVLLGLLLQNVVPFLVLRPVHASERFASTDVIQPAAIEPNRSETQRLVPTASPQRSVAVTKTVITDTAVVTSTPGPTITPTSTPDVSDEQISGRLSTPTSTPKPTDVIVLENNRQQTYLPIVVNGTPSPAEETWEDNVDESGGNVEAFHGNVQIEFPAGAVTQTVQVKVQTPDDHDRPPYFLGGLPFELEAESVSDHRSVETFSTDVTIRVAYDPTRINGAESQLSLFYYDEDLGSWVPLPTEVDAEANRLTARTSHFSNFDVKAQEWEAATLPSVKSSQVHSFTGAGTYAYPIQVPAGPAGLQPGLKLTYNSQAVDRAHNRTQASWVGMGWSLNTGYIKRDTRGTYDELDDDVFTLNVNGVSSVLLPAADGTYHTADERFWRIRYNGGDPNVFEGQDGTWTIWDKQGNTFVLGANEPERASFPVFFSCDDNRDDHAYVTWQWSLSRKTNKFGKSLRYTYHHETKNFHNVCGYSNRPGDVAVYPDTITYPHNRYRIEFERADDRDDYDEAWETGYYFTSFKRSRLTDVVVRHNADGDSSFEEIVRRYELSYADDAHGRVFPNVEWPQGGRTLTLVGVQEYGLNDSATLPATSFAYGDDIHLTDVHNGHGGHVHFDYEPWHSTEWDREQHRLPGHYRFGEFCSSIDDDWETVTGRMECRSDITSDGRGYSWLELFEDEDAPAEIETDFEHQFAPGTVYKITGDFKRFTPGTWAQVGIEGVESQRIQLGAGDHTRVSVEKRLQGDVSDPHLVIRCSDRCKVQDLEIVALPTRYRVVEKRISDDVTGESHAFRYRYDEPAMNDEAHSAGAGTEHPYTRANTEFRGHALVQELGPNGRVTASWFRQSDALSGRTVRSQVGTQSFWEAFDKRDRDAWRFSPPARHTIARLAGDPALKTTNSDNRWDTTHLARTDYSLQDGDIVQLQFRADSADTESRLAVESMDGDHWGIWLRPTDAGAQRLDLWRSNGAAETLIPANQFTVDAWYVLQLGVDDDQFLLRLWQRDGGPVRRMQAAMPAGKTWRFHQWTRSGTLWLDTYSEGTLLSETETGYAIAGDDDSSDDAGYAVSVDRDRLSTCDDEPCTDLNIRWVRQTYQKQLTFEQDAEFVGRLTEFQYRPADQQGQQYGNQTRVIEKRFDGGAFVPYRATRQQFYPTATDSAYLVGLPAYENTYACPGDTCDFSLETLERSTQHLYDGSRTFDGAPERGIRTGTRTFVCFVGQDDKCGEYRENAPARFQDVSFEYDAWGNTVQQVQYRNYGTAGTFAGDMPAAQQDRVTTTTTYDANYHTYKVAQTNAKGHTTRWKYDGVGFTFGVPTSKIDANGNPTTAKYDNFGRLIEIRRPYDLGEDKRATVAIDYHDKTPFWTAVHQKRTDDITQTVRKFYDGLGRLIQTQTANVLLDDGTRADVVVDTAYDAYGNKTRVTVPYTITPSSGWHGQNLDQSATTTAYDAFGRPVEVVAPDGSRQTHSYDDLTRIVTDSKQRTTRTETDIFGRTTHVVPPTGPTLEYTYDVLDQLVEVTKIGADSQRLTTSILYDAAGRKLSMDDPDMGTWSYTYDAAGNLLTQTDARDIVTHFRYDKLNRVSKKWYTAPTSAGDDMVLIPEPVRYIYDEGGSGANANGQRTRMVDGAGTTTWQYDKRGRVTNKTRTIDSVNTYELAYAYDSADTVTSLTYPDGEVVTTGYDDGRGLPSELSSSLGDSFVTEAGYDAHNRTRRLMLGNGVETVYDYYAPEEQGGRLHTLRTSDNSLNLTYRYDAVGNIEEIIDTSTNIDTQRLDFEYDALDRLTSAQTSGGAIPGYDIDYRYDSLGRLDQRTEFTRTLDYTYSADHPHAAEAFGGNSYAYDAAGNMTERVEDGITYTQYWTPDNKLARVIWVEDGLPYTTTFAYDGDGSRLLKIENRPVTQGRAEITTAYVDGIYEERYDTTAENLGSAIYRTDYTRVSWKSRSSRATRASLPTDVIQKVVPGLSAPPEEPCAPGECPGTLRIKSDRMLPEDVWQNDTNQPTIEWTWKGGTVPPDFSYYDVTWEKIDNGIIATAETTKTTYTPPPAEDGAYLLTVTARDSNGDTYQGWQDTFRFKYDGTPPTAPAALQETHGVQHDQWQAAMNDPAFEWTSSTDNASGLAHYDVYWGTSPTATVATTTTQTSAYDPPAISSGDVHYLRVRARDNAGNTSAWSTFAFKYDGIEPENPDTITVVPGEVQDDTWQNGVTEPVFMWAGADGTGSTVSQYHVRWRTGSAVTITQTETTSSSFAPPTVSEDGIYQLRLRTEDAAGNYSAWTTLFTFKYDGTAPTNPEVTETGGAQDDVWQNAVNKPAFIWNGATDAASGVAGYRWYWGLDSAGTSPDPFTTATGFASPIVPSGETMHLRMQTQDEAGNQSPWETVFTFRYDGDAPAISDVQPASNGVITDTQPYIAADLSDLAPGSGVAPAETTLIVDGEVVTPQLKTSSRIEYIPVQPLGAGQHFATLQIEDRAGNRSETNWGFTVDPATWVSIEAPADGTVLNNQQTSLRLGLEQQSGVRLTVTTPVTTVTEVVSNGYWRLDRLPLQVGSNVITVEVQDTAGNYASDTTTVTVDPAAHTALISAGSDVVNPTIADVRFDVTALAGTDYEVSTWDAGIRGSDGSAVTTFTGDGPADGQTVVWNGRNDAGDIVADGIYTYTLAVTVTDGASTETVTALPGHLQIRTAPPDTPTLRCDTNPLWFSVPPAFVEGTAPLSTERVLVSLGGEPATTTRVDDDGSWQAPVPLADAELRTVRVTAVDAAGNESAPSSECKVGLSLTAPFTLPHASLSNTYVGLDTTVALTATTRTTGGAPADAVWATVPPSDQTLTMTEGVAGTWTGAWHTATEGVFEGVAVARFDAEDVAVPVPNHGTQFVQPYLDLVRPETRLTQPLNGHVHAANSLQVAGRTEPLSTVIVRATRTEDNLTVTDTVTSTALGRWQTALALDDGTYSLSAHAVDRAGNVGESTEARTVLVDTSAPAIGPLAVPSRYIQPDSTIAVTTTVTDSLSGVDRVQALIVDVPEADQNKLLHLIEGEPNKYSSDLAISADTTDGQKPIVLRARDSAGNEAERTDASFVVDGTPPAVTDPVFTVEPAAANIYLADSNQLYYGPASSGDITVGVEAGDNASHATSGIASVTFPSLFANDGTTVTPVGAAAPATYTQRYTVDAARASSVTGGVRVEDRAGNVTTSSTVRANYDDTPPVVYNLRMSLSDHASGVALDASADTVYYGADAAGELRVAITAADADAGLRTITFPDVFDGGVDYDGAGTLDPKRERHAYTISGDETEQEIHPQLAAADTVGNVSVGETFTVVNDIEGPTVTVTATRTSGTSIVVSWAGADAASGVDTYDVQYRDGDGEWVPWFTDTISSTAEFIGIPGHDYVFRVHARDRVANTGSWQTTTVSLDSTTVTKYYNLGDRRVAMRRGVEMIYLQGDHLRSVSLATDENGDVVNEVRYTPFGQERWRDGAAGGRVTDFGYTGQRLEVGFGLMDYNARYYDPVLGRFISPDTTVPEPGKSQSFDRYAYVISNPIRHVDPSGHCWGAAKVIRNLQLGDVGYGTNCANIDTALDIARNTEVSTKDKLLASGYLGAMGAAHATFVLGTAIVAWGSVGLAGSAAETVTSAGSAACVDGDCANEVQLTAQINGKISQAAKYTRDSLPKLEGSIAEAFDGNPVIRTLKPGDLLYRSEAAAAQGPGPWFGTQFTKSAARAERWWNIVKWNNPREVLRTYKVTEKVSAYYGKVAGGRGTQILIPRDVPLDEIVRLVKETPLK